MQTGTSFKDLVLRVVSVLGLVALLLLGVWGIIQIALATPGFFTRTAKPTSPTATSPAVVSQTAPVAQAELVVALPTLVTSGQPFTLSWNSQSTGADYGYTISYSCDTNLSLYAPTPSGNSAKVPCNTPFNFTNATKNIALVAVLAGKEKISATFTVVANKLKDGTIAASGTAHASVLPAAGATATISSAPAVVTKPNTTTPTSTYYVAAKRATAPYGLPNLSVYIQSAAPSGGRWVMQFTVANTGTNIARSGWIFSALLPLNPLYTYTSPPQQALYPGDKIVYTLQFTMPAYSPAPSASNCGYAPSYTYDGVYNISNIPSYSCGGTGNNWYSSTYNYYANQVSYPGQQKGTVNVMVDSQNIVQEASEADNTASVSL